MKLLRGRYILITIVLIVVTAIFVFVNYRKSESVIINTSVSNTNVEVTQSSQCDIIADTFYLNFHSNMDSAAFYNELRSNPVTRDGVDVGYQKLEVYPTFNDHGCLDYVKLFNHSNESATIGYYAEKLKEELTNDASIIFSGGAPEKTEINESQGVGSDKIAKELMRLYGVPRIYKIAEATFEYVYKDKKVMREFSTKYPRKGVQELEVLSSRIYFYSDRYIQQQDLLEKEELLKMKKRGAQRDSLDATLSSRLK
jgi:hypothetical protein